MEVAVGFMFKNPFGYKEVCAIEPAERRASLGGGIL